MNLDRGAAPGALDGLLVADFSRVLAGPYFTMLLADLGAKVVKVESPQGDQTRHWGPPWSDGESTYYQAVNRNKQSVVLDLRQDNERRMAFALAATADIVVENFMPGRLARMGLGYDDVAAANPGVIYCSLSGFGSHEGGATLPGYDLVAQAVGGLMSITGAADGPPMKVGVALVDVLCGLHAAVGVLAALHARDRDGRGQLVEVDLMTSLLSGLTNQASGYLLAGSVPPRAGNVHPSVAPYETFTVADGDIVIATGSDAQFGVLCAELGLAEAGTDPRFATNAARVANLDELRRLISAKVQSCTRQEVVAKLRVAGVPCGSVNDISEAFAQAADIGLDVTWDVAGKPHVRAPFRLSHTPARAHTAPPALDADGSAIRDWLAGLANVPTSGDSAAPAVDSPPHIDQARSD